ncbi:MAG: hypothetical protein DRQ51_00740 [Gammaproteobacteria bacterium]|nr:MAG: hypothetical protein DRQ51_00740 [Gammaproteobacteria bacterium]
MQNKNIKKIKPLKVFNGYLKFLLFVSLVLLFYNGISQFWSDLKTGSTFAVYVFELPFSLYLISLLYFHKITNKYIKYIIPIIPTLFLYLSVEIFYNFLSRSPRISDFNNINGILNFSPLLFFIIIVSILILLSLILFLLLKFKKADNLKYFYVSILVRFLSLIVFVLIIRTDFGYKKLDQIFIIAPHADKATIIKNGRLFSFVQLSLLEKTNLSKLQNQQNNKINIIDALYKNPIKKNRNIYFVVMESFINPNYLTDIKFNKNPLNPKLYPYLINKEFSQVISPVYGGDTAQAEFEILTGIKALSKIQSIEFNVMKGGLIKSFIDNLNKNNYKSMAIIGATPTYFNSRVAYKSLGFDEVLFLQDDKNFNKNTGDIYVFDGDLFKLNLKKIKKHLSTGSQPLFNYVLGIYGHMPYHRNKQKRPDIIKISNHKNSNTTNISNQFYYRTYALSQYIKSILSIDSNAIILIASDHIPPILSNTIKYKYNKFINVAILMDGTTPINISGSKHYELPHIVYDILTQKPKNTDIDKKMQQLYYKALYQSIKINR